MADRDRFQLGYIADDGIRYRITTSENHIKALPAQYQVEASADDPTFPKRWKPRQVHGVIVNANGADRRMSLVVPRREDLADMDTFTVPNITPAFQVTGRTGEQRTIPAPFYDGVETPENGRVQIPYTDDEGLTWAITTTRAHAKAVDATVVVANPPSQLPKTIEPRHYGLKKNTLEGVDKHLKLIEPNPLAANWVSDQPTPFTIGTQGAFHVTGRKAESNHRSAPIYDVP
jgi:hypothetical protein